MKIAFYVEDGLEQIVFTPESKVEGDMLEKLHDGTRELGILKGSFYDCRGGWKRYTPYERSQFSYGADRGDESTIITLRPASAIEAQRVETEGLDAEHESAVAESETPITEHSPSPPPEILG